MILVAGATGVLGGLVCQRLRERGDPVRALVRASSDAARREQLRALGVELAEGDLRDRASLEAACRGATTVVSTVSSITTAKAGDSFEATDDAGTRSLVDAAKAAGAGHFVYVSFDDAAFPDSPLVAAKRSVEDYLKASGVPYTILKPGPFMEIWLGPMLGVDAANGTAKVFGSGEHPVPYVSVRDVAEYVVACVGNASARNRTLYVKGAAPVSQNDAVHAFEESLGRPLVVTRVPEEALEAQWRSAPDPMSRTFSSLMLGVARGGGAEMARRAADDAPFAIAPRSVRDYAAEVAAGKSMGTAAHG
ncbi:MAG TPA: SDR family oxidoreductase [Gemmatimonadaceae bacterium]|nr:SDR family oxidoreductase [Gemmatimonadaceae bacterium]